MRFCLILEIDTLEWDKSFEFDIKWNGKSILSSIMFVESSYNDSAYCKPEDAVGCLQIRKTMVDDINRILKRKGSYKRYSYQDRWNRLESINMFNLYVEYYGLKSAEEIARCWNGGPRGMNKADKSPKAKPKVAEKKTNKGENCLKGEFPHRVGKFPFGRGRAKHDRV